MVSQHLSLLLKNLPNLPGVYKMLGKAGEILYVGKAKSLKNRVSSYFSTTHDHPKTNALVQKIADIELIVVRNNTEALLLEQTLIKTHKPPYNILLRDDKSYSYLIVSKDKFPRISIGRGNKHSNGQHFGPYPSNTNAKEAILLLQKLFGLRTCPNTTFATAKRPCLEYQIKRCSAPCVNLIDKASYDETVMQALAFLNGDTNQLQTALSQKMYECAENLQFEQATFYRDRLAMLADITAQQAVYRVGSNSSADVFAIDEQNGLTVVHLLTVRAGKVLGGKNYFPDGVQIFDDKAEQLERFLLSFYSQIGDELPKEIIINQELENQDDIANLLYEQFGTKPIIKSAVQTYRREWLDLAILNANNALLAKLSSFYELKQRFNALQTILKSVCLDRNIDRIECFDISHTMGEMAVGSCVVFDSGGARKRDYRQYAIAGITAGDDYGAMRQVLTRRYSKHALPDLLLIDGGKGQLNVAKEVLTSLGKLDETLLMGVAKGEGRKAGLEVLHFLNHEPIDLPSDHKALHLIMHIRDEAHRFAITAHRKKRDKARSSSVLEVIPNLGEKRRRDLLAHFGGIGQLLSASQDEIAQVKGIGKVLAGTIYKSLHG